jgi:hypothetical protein
LCPGPFKAFLPAKAHFETNKSGGLDKTISPTLMTNLQAFPLLRYKIQLFAQNFQRMPFQKKYARTKTNLATLVNVDTHMSQR